MVACLPFPWMQASRTPIAAIYAALDDADVGLCRSYIDFLWG